MATAELQREEVLMTGDWIKIRGSLREHPKVLAIARYLSTSEQFCSWLTRDTGRDVDQNDATLYVTFDVLVCVTVASLAKLWSVANEHYKDGVLDCTDLFAIDDIVGVWGFGEAVESVGWAVMSGTGSSVTLPNFTAWNTPRKSRKAMSGAERSRNWREKQKKKKVTKTTRCGDVTDTRSESSPNGRLDETRLDEISKSEPRARGSNLDQKPADQTAEPAAVLHALTSHPWKFGGTKAREILDRGCDVDRLAAWEKYARDHGRPAAVSAMQEFDSPDEIPADPAKNPRLKNPRAAGTGVW